MGSGDYIHTHTEREEFSRPKAALACKQLQIFWFRLGFRFPPTWARSGLIRAGKDMIPYMATVGILAWAGMGWGRIRSSGHTRAMYRSKHHKSSLMVWPKHIYNILLHTVCKHMLAPVENSLLCLFHLT